MVLAEICLIKSKPMKTVLTISSILIATMGIAQQLETKKMNWHLESSAMIKAPASEVWRVLGEEFSNIDQWFSMVEFSRPIGINEVPDNVKPDFEHVPVMGRYTESKAIRATEVLTAYSNEERSFTYQAVGLPYRLVKAAQNQTYVEVVDAQTSRVTIQADMRFTALATVFRPVMKKRMSRVYDQLFTELEYYLQTGQAYPQPTTDLAAH